MDEIGSEKTKSSLRMSILIGCILAAIAIAGVGFWFSMKSSGPTSELPVIKANKTIFKAKPENPGGKIIPHQDSKVLEILEGLTEKDNRTEKLRLPDAAPELPPIALKEDDNSEYPESFKPLEKTTENISIPTKAISEDNYTKNDIINNGINLTNIISPDNSTQRPDINQKQEMPDNQISQDKVEKTPIVVPSSKPASPKLIEGEKTHKVQLAAFSRQKKARQQAAILMEKHKIRLNGIILEVTQIDTGSSGIYWRVITEPLRKDLANSTCNLLKSAGQDCIVRKIRKEG